MVLNFKLHHRWQHVNAVRGPTGSGHCKIPIHVACKHFAITAPNNSSMKRSDAFPLIDTVTIVYQVFDF